VLVESNYTTYTNYWDNFITSVEDVGNTLDKIFKREKVKKRNFIKCSTTFGKIIEKVTKKDDDNFDVNYSVFSPNDVDSKNHHIVNLNNDESQEIYKKYIISQLRELNEFANLLDSSKRYVGVHKLQVNVFYMVEVGTKYPTSLLHKLCSNQKGPGIFWTGPIRPGQKWPNSTFELLFQNCFENQHSFFH
jgi:hypothetical protein